jgi:hypothetical protein
MKGWRLTYVLCCGTHALMCPRSSGRRTAPLPPAPVPHLRFPETTLRPILAAPECSHRRLTGTGGLIRA